MRRTVAFSVGYFANDLLLILTYPAVAGPDMIAHHVIIGGFFVLGLFDRCASQCAWVRRGVRDLLMDFLCAMFIAWLFGTGSPWHVSIWVWSVVCVCVRGWADVIMRTWHASGCTFVCLYVCVHACVCVFVCVRLCMYVCMCAYVQKNSGIHMQICIYHRERERWMHTHTHTHAHTDRYMSQHRICLQIYACMCNKVYGLSIYIYSIIIVFTQKSPYIRKTALHARKKSPIYSGYIRLASDM